eukprot:4465434-Amphidinium_carterae.1
MEIVMLRLAPQRALAWAPMLVSKGQPLTWQKTISRNIKQDCNGNEYKIPFRECYALARGQLQLCTGFICLYNPD